MPCEPRTSSSRPMTRPIGTRGRVGGAGRPGRGGRACAAPAIDAAHAASLPIASSETWAPPPVSSRIVGAERDGELGARLAGAAQRRVDDVDGDDPRARGRRDHHRRQPDPAAAVDREPLARRGPGRPAGPRGRRSRTGSRARPPSSNVEAVRERDEVHVGPVDRDELGERAPVREARLGLAVADLVVAGEALRARAARAHERDRDPIARRPALDPVADGLDDAGQFVPGDVREPPDVRVVAHPAVPVAAAQAGGLDARPPRRTRPAPGRARSRPSAAPRRPRRRPRARATA